eukprot:TRINITY_DN2895_c0_g1_i1.p1 TRINITY_DN2895_c0_g1~~TRINITY_DN2895_c0_g1_i1.p1  ORF type:complete len:581 (-),score=142.94 TRINITY_DN2895_c0_g1_i1:94-1836(-)
MSSPSSSSSSPSPKTTIRVAGVPEHFVFPIFQAQEKGIFEKHGVEVEFVEHKGGTGSMINALKEGSVDIAVALTEGLVAEIAKNESDITLISTYVESPLCWAISVGKDSPINGVEELRGKTWGISRFTSGSHLMVFVLALQRGWDLKDLSFAVKGNIEGLKDGVNDGTADAFMWEVFMTKKAHDSGVIKKVGAIYTPWPCFMIAARKSVLNEKEDSIKKVLSALRESCKEFHQNEKEVIKAIAHKFDLSELDTEKWYSTVRITANNHISEAAIEQAIEILRKTGVVPDKDYDVTHFFDHRFSSLERDIKYMKLYNKPELITSLYAWLKHAGLASGSIKYTALLPYDQHHYHGVEALEKCIQETKIDANSRIINFGSGLGGCARFFAGKLGSEVLAVEIQDDLSSTASELTTRCALREKVHHISGDFLQIGKHLQTSGYDHIVSWLTVLHIPQRKDLFQICYKLLNDGGYFYAEDFYEKNPLTPSEKKTLKEEVYCGYLPSLEKYLNDLKEAGFKIEKAEDLTADWTNYTKERVEKYVGNKDEIVKICGEDIFGRLSTFYGKIASLFQAGNLGGVKIIARK